MSDDDPLIDGDHHIRLDALRHQRPVGGVDTDEQWPIGLLADRPQALEMLLQARARSQ